MTCLNLLPSDRVLAYSIRRRRRLWSKVLSATGAFSAIVIAVATINSPPTADATARLARLVAEQESIRIRAEALQNQMNEKTPLVARVESISRQLNWAPLLDDLAKWSQGQAQLLQITIALGTGEESFTLNLAGITRSQEFVGELVNTMESSDWFEEVTLTGTQRMSNSDHDEYRFGINCTILGYDTQAEALR